MKCIWATHFSDSTSIPEEQPAKANGKKSKTSATIAAKKNKTTKEKSPVPEVEKEIEETVPEEIDEEPPKRGRGSKGISDNTRYKNSKFITWSFFS